MDDDFDDYESDISLYEESDEESDGENDQDLNPTYLWTVQNSDRFEFPHAHCKIIWNRSRRIILVNVGVLYNQVCWLSYQ
jgi:hypothetical protein